MPNATVSSDMQHCIDECMSCHQICQQTAMVHCLDAGDMHVEPEHFRLMIGCAEICRTAASLMLSRVPLHEAVCAACAEICDACAESCESIGDMDECAVACRRCAASCRAMASGATPQTSTGYASQAGTH